MNLKIWKILVRLNHTVLPTITGLCAECLNAVLQCTFQGDLSFPLDSHLKIFNEFLMSSSIKVVTCLG